VVEEEEDGTNDVDAAMVGFVVVAAEVTRAGDHAFVDNGAVEENPCVVATSAAKTLILVGKGMMK